MDELLVSQVMDLLHTMQEGCQELYACIESGNQGGACRLFEDLSMGLTHILQKAELEGAPGGKKFFAACQSSQASLQRIRGYYRTDHARCLHKIEFELLPLLQETYLFGYLFLYMEFHPEHLEDYLAKEYPLLYGNPYIDEAMQTGQYKYDVSLFVMAYNKLDYTKRCVESLLANIPEGLNYELILGNHGSTDGTKEYFESIHPHKQLDIAVNGGGIGALGRIVEGEFTIQISNDVIITPHAIENLLACIRSDPRIGWAVPATPNISNLQTIPAQYASDGELMLFAKKNNQQDACRWEQRVRLCNPIDIRRNSVFYGTNGLCAVGYIHTLHPVYIESFPDDRISMLLRRNGYKMMLAKDAYCHHFGSVTIRDEIKQQNEQKYYTEGRQEFSKAFGVDPWGTGFCFDPVFLKRVVGEDHNHIEILGINCGLGSNSLKIKEQVKEYCRNTDCTLINLTDDGRFLSDLQGISDRAATITAIKQLKAAVFQHTFQYIVWEAPFLEMYKFKTLLDICLNHLNGKGILFLKLNHQSKLYIEKNFSTAKVLGNDWVAVQKAGDFKTAPRKE